MAIDGLSLSPDQLREKATSLKNRAEKITSTLDKVTMDLKSV